LYSPTAKDLPIRLNLPAPNGIYDVSVNLFSAAYVEGASAKICVKTPQDPDFREIEHGEVTSKNYMRPISPAYHIRDDQFTLEFRPIAGQKSTSIADIEFVRSPETTPVSGGYLSPYFPAAGSGSGSTEIIWNSEIPEGTGLQVKARWVMRNPDGTFRFLPWARIVDGQKGKLELPGKGDFFQYYVNFIRFTRDDATPKLRGLTISIPCNEESGEQKGTPSR